MAAAKAKNWVTNDRLRVEATRNLIAVAEANRVKRFIFESYFGAYPDCGDQWIDESVALAPIVPFMRSLVEAEALVDDFGEHGGESVNLRFGRLYGPGRASDALAEIMRKRQMPIVGSGDNYVPSIHTEDAGASIARALTAPPGTYNVSDDEPMRQSELTRFIAEALDAPAPRRLPRMLVRLMIGRLAYTLTISQRVSNQRFKEATGWRPQYRSAKEGWTATSRSEAGVKTAVQVAGVS